MRRTNWERLLSETARLATDFLEGLSARPVAPRSGPAEMHAAVGAPLPDEPADPSAVLAELVRLADPGITAMPSGRFFGWVIGGGLPAAVAADWMTTVWDQA